MSGPNGRTVRTVRVGTHPDRTSRSPRTSRGSHRTEPRTFDPDRIAWAHFPVASGPAGTADAVRTPHPGPTGPGQTSPATVGDHHEKKETTSVSTSLGDVAPINATALTEVADLELQAADAENVAEVAVGYLTTLAEWVTTLPDRYAAAPFRTAGLTRAVGAVSEAVPDTAALLAVREALAVLVREAEETKSLAEVAEVLDAEGDVAAYRTG